MRKRNQHARSDARGRPEEGHSYLSPQSQPKPGRQEISDADRDGESDRARPRVAEVMEGERRPVAFLVRHP